MRLRMIFHLTTLMLAALFLSFSALSWFLLMPLQEESENSAEAASQIDEDLQDVTGNHQQGVNRAREMAISIYQEQVAMTRYLDEPDPDNLPDLEVSHNVSSNNSFGRHGEINAFLNESELVVSMDDVFFSHNALLYEFTRVKEMRQAGHTLTPNEIANFSHNLTVLVTMTVEGGDLDAETIALLCDHTYTYNTFDMPGTPFHGNNLFDATTLNDRLATNEPIYGLQAIIDSLDLRIAAATEASEASAAEAMQSSQRARDQVALITYAVGALAGASLILALGAGFFLSRKVERPLKDLTDSMDQLSMGRFDTEVPQGGFTELREMSQAFGRMVSSLRILAGRR